jgi:hypothetical protein
MHTLCFHIPFFMLWYHRMHASFWPCFWSFIHCWSSMQHHHSVSGKLYHIEFLKFSASTKLSN